MKKSFEDLRAEFNIKNAMVKELPCFLPVHLTTGKIENNLFKKDGTHNEQFYKWEFLNCFVGAGLCSKDYIGTEIQFPKGNKSAAPIKLDAAIFDNKAWKEHYHNAWTKKDDSRYDDFNWLKDHLLCAFESKKEDGKDVKANFNSA